MTTLQEQFEAQLLAARRGQILDAAEHVFAARGYHKATIRTIAQQAGVADGTIYNYFANKEELLLGLLDRLNESEQREADLAAVAGADMRQTTLAYMRHRMAVLQPSLPLFRAVLPELLANPALRERYVQATIAPTLATAEAQFTQMAAAGLIQPLNIPILVRLLASQFFGLLLFHLLDEPTTAALWDSFPETLVALLFDGLEGN